MTLDRVALRVAHPIWALVLMPVAGLFLLTGCHANPDRPQGAPPQNGGKAALPQGMAATPGSGAGSTGNGPTATSSSPPSGLGIQIYPGARPLEGLEGQPALETGPGAPSTVALMQTQDSVEKVADFYRGHFSTTEATGTPAQPKERTETRDGSPMVVFSLVEGGRVRTAEIRQGEGVTLIELMSLAVPGTGSRRASTRHIPGLTPGASPRSNGSLDHTLSESGRSRAEDQPSGR